MATPRTSHFNWNQLDLDALWRSYLHGRLTGHSAVAGSIDLRGPLRQPDQWIIDGKLTSLALDVENVKVHNQDPILFSLADRSARFSNSTLRGREPTSLLMAPFNSSANAASISPRMATSTSSYSPVSMLTLPRLASLP